METNKTQKLSEKSDNFLTIIEKFPIYGNFSIKIVEMSTYCRASSFYTDNVYRYSRSTFSAELGFGVHMKLPGRL
jgi:hypothetical protein